MLKARALSLPFKRNTDIELDLSNGQEFNRHAAAAVKRNVNQGASKTTQTSIGALIAWSAATTC